MATYIPGITDFIPQIQSFTPDYNFYAGALELKQNKYDSARAQLSTLYGSLLNSPLTRDDTTASRDKFFKTIEQDIQKIVKGAVLLGAVTLDLLSKRKKG